MDYPNDRRDGYYDDNTVEQTPWQSYTEPMRTPCRRKGHGWIVLVAVLIVALAAAIGIWRWVQNYSVQLERTPDGMTLRVEELMPILGIGRNTAYELVRSGKLRSIRVGRQVRIPKNALIEFLNENRK